MTTGPFYAFQYEPSAWVTIGGIRTNDRLQAIDGEGVAIPGLYVAGNTMGRRLLVDYPVVVAGISLGSALTFGRLAGKNAAAAV